MKLFDIVNSGGVYIIAEMSANHAGKLANAIEIIHAAKEAGADCLKIQTYTADTLTLDCDNDYFRIKGGLWDGYKLYDLYKEAYTPWEWHRAIKDECEKAGMDFLSTPFDKSSVDFLLELGVEFFKIASFELVDIPLIEYVASKGKPMIISCGMGSIDEIQDAIDACKRQGNDQIVLLKCCSEYPANYLDMNLAVISDMKKRFDLPIGLSDHSVGSVASVVGVSLGACVVEKHFCVSRQNENPDSSFSMEPEEFSSMIHDIRSAIDAKGSVSYELSESEKRSTVFRRSLFASKDIKSGETITEANVRSVRPSYGMKPKFFKSIIGKKATCDIEFGTPISEEMIRDREMNIERCNLRPVGWSDVDLFYEWANDTQVRNNSFNSEIIPFDQHKLWFENCMNDENILMYILCKDESKIGQIRLDCRDGIAKVNYSIAQEFRGHGYGKIIIRLMESTIRIENPNIKFIKAIVKNDNVSSQKVFIDNCYEGTYIENEKHYIFMKEL